MARACRLFAEERAAAANGRIELLLQETPLDRFPELVEHPLLGTYGAFERLGKIFAETAYSDPARARAIAELEISIAENLSTVLYPRATLGQAHGYAWKDLGTVLRLQGRNQESLEALETAARVLQIPSLQHDLAIIRFSIAVTLQELERYEESRIHEGKAESASDLGPRISVGVDCSDASDDHPRVAGEGVHRHAPDVSGA